MKTINWKMKLARETALIILPNDTLDTRTKLVYRAIEKASLCPKCDREKIEKLVMLDYPPA